MLDANEILSPQYHDAVRSALWVQAPIAILCILLLDGGVTAKYCGTAMLGFWLGVACIAVRRPWMPTKIDLWYVRWGFIPVFFIVHCIGVVIWNQ